MLDITNQNRRFMFRMGGNTVEGFGPSAKQKLRLGIAIHQTILNAMQMAHKKP